MDVAGAQRVRELPEREGNHDPDVEQERGFDGEQREQDEAAEDDADAEGGGQVPAGLARPGFGHRCWRILVLPLSILLHCCPSLLAGPAVIVPDRSWPPEFPGA